MKHVLIAFGLVLCACAEPAPAVPEAPTPAVAAPSGAWTDPSNRFSVDFVGHGWTPLADSPNDFEHTAYQNASHLLRMCGVSEQRAPAPGRMTQEQLNQHIQSQPLEVVAGIMAGDVSEQAYLSVDGVSIAAFRLEQQGMHLYFRNFFLPTETGVTQVSLSCGGTLPINEEEAANFQSVLNSLRIAPEATL